MTTIKRPPKMTLAILEYAALMPNCMHNYDSGFTPGWLLGSFRGRWASDSVKVRTNAIVHLGLLERISLGQPRRGIESRYAITDAGLARLDELRKAKI